MQDNQDAQAKLYAALAKAQGEFAPLAKNREVTITTSKGGSFKFRYADLEAVLSSTRAALSKHGLAVVQVIDGSSLITQVLHEDGGVIQSTMQMPATPQGGDIKSFGAAVTYCRRYALTSILCVAADDDLDEDGQPAGGQQQSQQQPQSRPTAVAELPWYPQDRFDELLPARSEGVASGKTTPQQIIDLIESRARLTDDQRKTLLALETVSA